MLGLGVFISVALASYNTADPSFNRAAAVDTSNRMGHLGAYVTDPLIQFFGLSSVIFAVVPLILGLRCIKGGHVSYLWPRIAAIFCAAFFLSSLIVPIQVPENWPFYVSFGGLVGDIVFPVSVKYLTFYGHIAASALLFFASFYIAAALRFSEVRAAYRFAKALTLFVGHWILRLYKMSLNVVRKLQKKELIELEEAPKKISLNSGDDDVVEFKEPKAEKKKKRVVRQAALKLDPSEFELPDFDLLTDAPSAKNNNLNSKALEQNAKLLKKVLEDFGVKGEILKVRPGPVVTLYELEPAAGTKSSRVIGLSDDIARSMSSISARISVVPGRNVLGVELPNADRETVYLRELMETEEYRDQRIKLPIALGKDIGGEPVMADLSRMPHLLIAGTTGSGKSVAVNAMILSYLYRLSPDECKFIMIDPKMLELSVYDGIPHLLSPVVTDPKKAVVALKWAVREMEDRYRLMSHLGVRNITGYNKRIEDAVKKGETLDRTVQTGFDPETGDPIYEKQEIKMEKMPFIVIIVDEMADLMLTAGKDIESSIQRLAQMARAAGIHMVMATQRPSVDVITGVIKANFPTRISFQVTSRIDSRTILGEMGAEQLLGMGDMLYMAGGTRVTRVHGPFVDDKEVEKVVNHLKKQGKPSYVEDVTKDDESFDAGGDAANSGDELYDKAVAIVLRDKKASTSYIQRQLKIGYNRAANLIEKMEEEGVVGQANHAGKREILVA